MDAYTKVGIEPCYHNIKNIVHKVVITIFLLKLERRLMALEAIGPNLFKDTSSGYIYVVSPVDWTLIDVLAAITVVFLLFAFFYKGVGQRRVLRYPQIQIAIPYSQWETKLISQKPPMGAGKVIAALIRTIFVDALAMDILKCQYGRAPGEIVATRVAKRAAKLMIIWGFIFAAVSTTLAYLMFPHNMIALNLNSPPRIFGMIGGVLMIVGAALWLGVRYKEVRYKGVWDLLGAEFLPLMVLLLGISGFLLQAAIYIWAFNQTALAAEAFLWTAIHFHAIIVALFFWALFWTNGEHIVYQIFWRMYEYIDRENAGRNTRLPPTNIKHVNRTGKEIQPGY